MPLTKIEHEQLAAAIQNMDSRDETDVYFGGARATKSFVDKDNILFLISRYTQEFYSEQQGDEDPAATHGGTD